MQVGSSSQTTYQNYQQSHAPTSSAADDQERKRRYLSLLPPPQVIEICLTFDIHTPASVKTTIWPADLDEAIAVLQKASVEKYAVSSASSPNTSVSAGPKPISLDPPQTTNIAVEAPGPPGPLNSTSTPPGNPLQRFVYANQPAYPHTPYYPQASWSSYSHPPYGATQPYAPPPPMVHHQPRYQEVQSPDEMPSYEDMIVEALNDVRDPEGLAPKDIYTWMVDHYRVQANFRPSASQALQKAYKRGRFEKSLSGKYRLNPHWKGGNTTRRTTRRPQSHSNSLPPPPQTRHPSFPQSQLNHASKIPALPQMTYVLPYHSSSDNTSPTFQSHISEIDATVDLSDAFEAAQHILKALNFGGDLLKTSHQPEENSTSAPAIPSLKAVTTTVQDASDTGETNVDAVRAELQAQLVLLAAQLSEVAGVVPELANPSSNDSSITTTTIEALAHLPAIGGNEISDDISSQLLTAASSASVSVLDGVKHNVDSKDRLTPIGLPLEAPSPISSNEVPPTSIPTPETTPNDADYSGSDDEDMDEVIV